jgi:hypothetical protein
MLVNLPRVVFEFWNLDLGAQLGISLNKGRQGFIRSEEKISTVGYFSISEELMEEISN